MPNLIEQLEYAACGQGLDAEQTLHWKARGEILRLQHQRDEMAKVIRTLTPIDQLPVRKLVSFETAELIYSEATCATPS